MTWKKNEFAFSFNLHALDNFVIDKFLRWCSEHCQNKKNSWWGKIFLLKKMLLLFLGICKMLLVLLSLFLSLCMALTLLTLLAFELSSWNIRKLRKKFSNKKNCPRISLNGLLSFSFSWNVLNYFDVGTFWIGCLKRLEKDENFYQKSFSIWIFLEKRPTVIGFFFQVANFSHV